MLKDYIRKVVDRQDLTEKQAEEALHIIMNGQATPSQIACLITALRMKGETVEEITGFARTMRAHAIKITPEEKDLVDTCGTGGDVSHTFNISTMAAIVAAAAEVVVAKHGNRSVSSKCGSADILEAVGIKIDLHPEQVTDCINQVGIGFLFAPLFHKAMKFVLPPRQEIGIRTIFNILGPLTNPASANKQVLGVYDPNLTDTIAHVLKNLGAKRALVVHGNDGLDEISISAGTKISELKDGKIKNYEITPEEVGLERGKKESLVCSSVEESKRMVIDILEGREVGDPQKIVLLNAGAVIYVSGKAKTIRDGVESALFAIESGAAYKKLQQLIVFTSEPGCKS